MAEAVEERKAAKRSRDSRLGGVTKAYNKVVITVAVGEQVNVKRDYNALSAALLSYQEAAEDYSAKVSADNSLSEEEAVQYNDETTKHALSAARKYKSGVKLVRKFFLSRGLNDDAPHSPEASDDEGDARPPALAAIPPAQMPAMPRLSPAPSEADNGEVIEVEKVNMANISRDEFFGLMSLPKAEVLTFSGEPLEYHSFMIMFEEQVGSLGSVPDRVKLSRLIQHTTGPAREAIRACTLFPDEGYLEALSILKSRYGNSFIIADSVLRGLKDGKQVKTSEQMSQLADELSNGYHVLKLVNMIPEVNTQDAIFKICERIPVFLRNRWRREVYKYKRTEGWYPDFSEFMRFVKDSAEEMCDPMWGEKTYSGRSATSERKTSTCHQKRGPAASSFFTTPSAESKLSPAVVYRRPPCILCTIEHGLLICPSFKSMKVPERWDLVRKHKLCINCLKSGHCANECKSSHMCTVDACGVKHSNFLHVRQNVVSATTHVKDTTASFSTNAKQLENYLPCVNVKINGQIIVSALLDSGSSNTFCDRHLARTLGLTGRKINYNISTLTNSGEDIQSELVNFNVTSVDGKESLPFNNVYVTDSIPVDRPDILNVDYDHFKGIQFAKMQNVQLLIGQDQSEALLPLEVRRGLKREPFATRTIFGWALNGPNQVPNVSSRKVVSNFVKTMAHTGPDINSLIHMDDEGVCNDVGMSKQDKHVIELWENECIKVGDKYQLPIPFKLGVEVPNNFHAALSRLQKNKHSLLRRNLYEKYNDEILKLLGEGYAEKVPQGEPQGDRVWYLPHQAVVTDKKPGKLRVVFDCAAQFKGESLNDKCLQGPNLTNKLLDVLLRFRQDPYVIVGDIQAMYYQVIIPLEQRDALRFLWYDGDQVVHYRMTRHVFGGVWCASSSSFALLRTVQDNSGYPKVVVDTVRESFYVDDCLRSLPDRESVSIVMEGTKELLSKGGFNLTKFVINDPHLMNLVPVQDRAKEVNLVKDGSVNSKALGINWSVTDDMFYFDVNLDEFGGLPLTKRKMLSLVSSLYDPLGLVGPMVVLGRLVLQEVTRLKFGWDDKVPDSLVERWLGWVDTLASIKYVRIPRCIKPLEFNDGALELHNFSDASQVAYGTVSYLRCINKSGHVSVSLVMAKSKVAPIKPVTIPRLELQAALLAARVDNTLRSELRLELNPSYFWVDSEIVLCYLSNSSRRFQTFVANRVGAIQELTESDQWNFIPGSMNPADLITRGKEMTSEEELRWCHGPEFLRSHKSNWPDFGKSPGVEIPEGDPELRSRSCFVTKVCEDRLPEIFLRRSSFYTLKRTLVWLCRYFKFLCNNFLPDPKLSLAELDEVEEGVIRYVQGLKYGQEVRALQAGKHVPADSRIVSLNPVLDSRGILVVGGRNAGEARRSIIPHDHPISSMIAADFHAIAHCGTEWTVSKIREKFWITKVRVVLKSVSSRCIFCKKFFGAFCGQKMSDLPPERVVPGDKPFAFIGLDCFGPFDTKLGRRSVKRYGCIFTCFSIRAIHIEKLDTMDTDSFLNAFRRFVARRGRPVKVWSDNGSNFVGGTTELKKALEGLDNEAILEYGLSQSIEWNFNPPTASHMGGVWERLIRTVRKVFLGISRGDHTYNDEVLSTWFCEVESIVNGRPITRVGDDSSDFAPLSPNHLLLLSGQNHGPPGNFSGGRYQRRWRHVQHLSDVFWKRWVREYLPELQIRAKWHRQKENLRVGDFVLLLGEDTPRTLWPQGIISHVFPSNDGLVRSVRVRTKSSSFIRPVTKVVLLEGSSV